MYNDVDYSTYINKKTPMHAFNEGHLLLSVTGR